MTLEQKARNRFVKLMKSIDLGEDLEESTGRKIEDMDIDFMISDCIALHQYFAQSDLEARDRVDICNKLQRFIDRFKN